MLLTALGENDIDEILSALYSEDGEWIGPEKPVPPPSPFALPGQPPTAPAIPPGQEPSTQDAQQEAFVEAVREMRNALLLFQEKYGGEHVPLTG
jgi:hypothetical protein